MDNKVSTAVAQSKEALVIKSIKRQLIVETQDIIGRILMNI
jgi:hypothetical protein